MTMTNMKRLDRIHASVAHIKARLPSAPPLPEPVPGADVVPLGIGLKGKIRRRRAVAGILGGALVQGVLAVWVAGGAVGAGVGSYAIGFTIGQIVSAAVLFWACVAFLFVVGRATEREKLADYRHELHDQRLSLRRARAERELYRQTLAAAGRLRSDQPTRASVQRAVVDVVETLYEVLACRHDDLAVTLVDRRPDRHHVLHTATCPSRRWRRLRAGKSCPVLGREFEEALADLARHTRAFSVEVGEVELYVGVLCADAFDADDERTFAEVPHCLDAVAHELRGRPVELWRLRSVS